MKNLHIIKIYKLLELLKKENLPLKIRAKILINLKNINSEIETIKELEENLISEELDEKIKEYNEKRNNLIIENDLEGKKVEEISEDIMTKFNSLELEYSEVFEEKNKKIKEYNEYLIQECESDIDIIKFELDDLKAIELTYEYDDVLELVVNF